MSDDDRIDYRQMYPVEGRNRKRRSANPRPQRKPEPRGGFFRDEPKSPTKDVREKISEPRSKISSRQRRDPDGLPMRSMTIVTREMLAEDPSLRTDDLMEQLESLGYEASPTAISMIRKDFIDVLRSCERAGTITVHAWQD